MEQARYPQAEEAFTTAHTRAAALAARHPANGDMIFERGQAEFWIAMVARRRGDNNNQHSWLVRYRNTALALAAAEGPTPRAQLEVVYGHYNLAVLDLERDDLTAAYIGFRAQHTVLEALHAAKPADPQLLADLANANSWLGTTAERDGRYADAMAHYDAMGVRYEELVRLEPDTAGWRFERAQSLTVGGNIRATTGQRDQAARYFAEATALLRELVASDPANKRWLSTKLRLQLMRAALTPAAPDAILPGVIEARQGLETLAAAEPTSVNFARLTVMAWTTEARLLLAGDRLPEASGAIARARHFADPLLQNAQADAWTRHLASHVLILEGRIAAARGDTVPTAHWDRAREVLGSGVAASHDWRFLEPAALANLLAGRPDAAAPLITKLKNFGFRPIDPFTAATLGLAE
jgi:serine/threonine-protein kinase